jgi:NitT/TauT family transport system permease protein
VARSSRTATASRASWASWEPFVLGLAGFFLVLGLWELAVRLELVRAILVSSPSAVLEAGIEEFADGDIWADIGISLVEYLGGMAFAIVIGFPIGIAGGWSDRLGAVINPWLTALYVTPVVALVPVFILWFGIGVTMKIFLVFLVAVFPIAINAVAGVRAAEHRFVRVARSFGASQWRLFRTVILPGTIPFFFTGVRQASGRALVGVVVAELVAANQGIGFMISIAGSTFNTSKVMLGIVLLAIFGVFVARLLERVESRFESWRVAP